MRWARRPPPSHEQSDEGVAESAEGTREREWRRRAPIALRPSPDFDEERVFDAIRKKTAQGAYEAVNYHRFADDIVVTVSGHHTKRGWVERVERAQQRLGEQLAPLGVELNAEKTKVVNMLKGEAHHRWLCVRPA